MKPILSKFILVALFFITASLKAQISIYESPCEGNKSSQSNAVLIEIAKYGEADNPKIIIEPNSVRDRLEVKLDDKATWDLLIFNCNGQLVRLGLIHPGKNKILLDDLTAGNYFVYMSKGEERWVKKIKKE